MTKVITQIQVGPIDEKVGWVLTYDTGLQESYSLHLGTARQFMQGLQEVILLMEHQLQQASQGTRDGMGVHDQVSIRLTEPGG
jgi:hypothetical protein